MKREPTRAPFSSKRIRGEGLFQKLLAALDVLPQAFPAQAMAGGREERALFVPREASEALREGAPGGGERLLRVAQERIGFRHLEGQFAVRDAQAAPLFLEGPQIAQGFVLTPLDRQ